ncbi:MAG: lamin tail domain-containing protein [Kiritimatiellae bacterium]|nr:lamin tail domain-containing protein [Kiritimatiellia bacterium]
MTTIPTKSLFNVFSTLLLCTLAACTALADVYISEFMADNSSSLQTAAGVNADWIELHNHSAVEADISGWFLTDDISLPTQWSFPPETRMAPNSYLIVFADGSEHSITKNELHCNFRLSKNGEYLALIQADGSTVACEFAPSFPKQESDVSYGLTTITTPVITRETPARYRIPNADGTAPWHSATGGVGFTDAPSSFTVHYYEMNANVTSVAMAETMVANSAYWKTTPQFPLVGEYSVINMHGSAGNGNFGNDDPFPNHGSVGVDKNNFVVIAETVIYIPAPGLRSFGVGSDDGFRLAITGHGQNFSVEHLGARGFGTTVGAFNFPAAGYYDLRLIFFEQSGGATLELSCAQGSYGSFDSTAFKLLGDPAAGVLLAGAIGAHINTDIRSAMLNINSRMDAEWGFELPQNLQPEDTISLALRYIDGCAIAVNGQPITAFNTPAALDWNSAATLSRSLEQGLIPVTIEIPSSVVLPGSNTLSIIGLNNAASDTDFLTHPALTHTSANRYGRYFPEPTPGAANGAPYNAPTPKVTVTVPRGFKNAPFWAELLCIEAPAAEIRYTTDGSVPGIGSLLYTAPLHITTTTTLRAAVIDPQSYEQRTKSVSWIFLEDVLTKDNTTPPGWPANRAVNNHEMQYGMAQNIVTGDRERLLRGMTNDIPSISIVTDLKHLFSPQSGIYVNPSNDGREWERPVSVEMIDTARGQEYEFQVNAGLRIRGAFSRSPDNPKHSFRLFFRSVYGDSKLKFKLFDDEGTDTYDNVDLRTAQNYSWAYQKNDRNTFAREVFSRDTQRDMGVPYTRSRYYHLYLNGQYWGLYQTQERGNDNWAESYLGGKDDDYDCIKVSHPSYALSAADGNFDGYFALHNYAVNQGFSGAYSNNYWSVQGRDPDNSVNTNKPCYLDQDNLIKYMLNCYYTGDPDSPISAWGNIVNNIVALYNRNTPAGFTWLRHDAEHSLGAHVNYGVNTDLTMLGSNLTEPLQFNPATLHIKLCEHPEYRMRFADLVYQHLFNEGALTPEQCRARFQARTAQIDSAIVAESARWGYGRTRADHWIPACNTVLNTYLPFRSNVVINQFKAKGWYPQINPPLLSTNSATVPAGYQLGMSAETTFYYTTDSSDPRAIGGSINPASTAVLFDGGATTLIAKGSVWHFYDLGAEPPLAGAKSWREPDYPDTAWQSGPAILGFAGSSYVNPVATTTRRFVNNVAAPQVTTTYFRRSFSLTNTNGITVLTLDLLRDDGAVIYINGVEAARSNMPAGTITYDTLSAGIVGGIDQNTYFPLEITDLSALKLGSNLIAVELHQCNAGSSDLYLDLALTAHFNGNTTLPIAAPTTIKARALKDGEWSALAEISLDIIIPPQDYHHLRVTELMYAPIAPADPAGPLVNDDFAWLELRNTGSSIIDLDGISFVSGIAHTFSPYNLLPGARLVLAKNPGALAERHPTNTMQVLAWSGGNLARRGETIAIASPAASNILSFTYSSTWYPETYNTGRSIVVVDTAAAEPLWSTAENWRPSRASAGTPGTPDAPAFNALAMTPVDHMTVSAEGLEGTIELWYSEDLEVWVPCDSQVWSRENNTILIHLKSPLLPNQDRGFFQLRISD